MDAEINNVIYMELYSGAKRVDDEYYKTNVARSIDRDSTLVAVANGMFHFVGFRAALDALEKR
jgi:hypothetical protein